MYEYMLIHYFHQVMFTNKKQIRYCIIYCQHKFYNGDIKF